MSDGSRFVLPYQTVIDNAGVPLPGALLFFYASGTSTPLNTYADVLLTIPNANPVQANAAGEFPNIFISNASYKVVLTDSLSNPIWTADPVSGIGVQSEVQSHTFDTTANLLTAFGPGVILSNGTQASTTGRTSADGPGGAVFFYNSTDTTSPDNGGTIRVDAQGRRWYTLYADVNPLLFGADPTGTVDSTAAFANAQLASLLTYETYANRGRIRITMGVYKLANLRIYCGVVFDCDGPNNVWFLQYIDDQPAINMTSDASTGQLIGCNIGGFSVTNVPGANDIATATVPAVKINAQGAYAIENCILDFKAAAVYSALAMTGTIYDCNIRIDSAGSTGPISVTGPFNTFDVTINSCTSDPAITVTGFGVVFTKLYANGPINCSAQDSTFISPVIETINCISVATGCAFYDIGFNNVWISPTLTTYTAADAAKLTGGAFSLGFGTIIISPNFIAAGSPNYPVANPFTAIVGYSATIVGPGRNGCTNKMETVFTGVSGGDLRPISFVGDCSAFTAQSTPHGGKVLQKSTPSGPFNNTILNNTDQMLWITGGDPGGQNNVNIGNVGNLPQNNQVLSVSSNHAITGLTWASPNGDDVSSLPTSITGGVNGGFSMIYSKADAKWYPL